MKSLDLVLSSRGYDEQSKEHMATILNTLRDIVITSCSHEILRRAQVCEDEDAKLLLKEVAANLRQGMHFSMDDDDDYINALGKAEHNQWMAWSKSVASEVSEERRERWKRYWVPYEQLPDSIKTLDLVWARHAAGIRTLHSKNSVGRVRSKCIDDLKRILNNHDEHQFDDDMIDMYKNAVVSDMISAMEESDD